MFVGIFGNIEEPEVFVWILVHFWVYQSKGIIYTRNEGSVGCASTYSTVNGNGKMMYWSLFIRKEREIERRRERRRRRGTNKKRADKSFEYHSIYRISSKSFIDIS